MRQTSMTARVSLQHAAITEKCEFRLYAVGARQHQQNCTAHMHQPLLTSHISPTHPTLAAPLQYRRARAARRTRRCCIHRQVVGQQTAVMTHFFLLFLCNFGSFIMGRTCPRPTTWLGNDRAAIASLEAATGAHSVSVAPHCGLGPCLFLPRDRVY